MTDKKWTLALLLATIAVTGDGDTWYLMIPFHMTEDSIPEEGAEISVEAAESRMSPHS